MPNIWSAIILCLSGVQAMLNPDFRKRPIAEAVLKHRFMIGAVV